MMRAFPTNKTLLMQDDNEKLYVQSFENLGMDLRDYFAAKALPALIGATGSVHVTVEAAYMWADAMMKARETNDK